MKHLSRKVVIWLALTTAVQALAVDKLVIISPHRKSIQQEFIPKFKEHYKSTYGTEVQVDWLDQGGTSDDVRFVRSKAAANPKSTGIDIFWGGGASTFVELSEDGLLAKYTLPKELAKEVPDNAAGVPLYDKTEQWYASAMSSFGVFYNKKLIQLRKLPEPKTWTDLANPKYSDLIVLADPRRSGSASAMNNIILQGMGWNEGWALLTEVAGNTKRFTHSSSDPIKAVVSGDAAIAMAIDFYANAKIADLGEKNLGFALPPGQTVLDPDPVAILKGAPNRQVAERFVNFVLSADAQKLLVLPKGEANGPKFAALGRMAVNTRTYEETKGKRPGDFNPFEQKAMLKLDVDKTSAMRRPLNDLLGAILIDTHKELRAAWKGIVQRGANKEEIALLGKPPVSEAQILELAKQWEDDVFRNKRINEWVEFARAKYMALEKGIKVRGD